MPTTHLATRGATAPSPPAAPPSTAATSRPSQHASSSHQHPANPSPQNGLHFVANHHRKHNPQDPKLRAFPVFRSRRSSLLGSVLRSKPKENPPNPRRSSNVPPRLPTALPTQLRVQSSHQHTQSLPAASFPTALQPDLGCSGISNLTAAQHRHSHTTHLPPHVSQSESRVPDHRHTPIASASSPVDLSALASLPCSVDQPDGSASTCSPSPNPNSLHLASDSTTASSPLTHPPFVSQSAPLASADADHRLDCPSRSMDPDLHTVSSVAPVAHHVDASESSQAHLNMPEQSLDVSRSTPSIFAASRTLPPIITHIHPSSATSQPQDTDAHIDAASGHIDAATGPVPSRQTPPAEAPIASASEQRFSPSAQALSDSTSAFVTSPQRFSSLGRSYAARSTPGSDLQSSFGVPRAPARDINDELDSPSSRETLAIRAERRMSMLDFLAVEHTADLSPRLAQASISAEDLSRSAPSTIPSRKHSHALVPASMPLVHASRQLRLEAAANRSKTLQPKTIDLCDKICVNVEPLVDRLTMFGSMQSSSNYSLAGTVVVHVPKLVVPRLSSAAAVARDGSTSDQPSVHVEALTVRFTGYSVYVDATGRFNAIKLTELSQQLLQPQGFSCPVQLVETGDRSISPDNAATSTETTNASHEALKYETEFDLSIPGWLPASQRSRFGATFYCVQATAIVEGRAILSAVSGFEDSASNDPYGQSSISTLARSLESELVEPADVKGAASQPATLSRAKSKTTWLNKTAKQLQLRTSKKSTGPELDSTASISSSRRGSGSKEVLQFPDPEDPLYTKTTEASNQTLSNGQHSIKSACLSILVRRCRDVVPVPVARLARLATASQMMRDPSAIPSLSQSMVALAGLQDDSDLISRSQGMSLPVPGGQGRHQISASASAPNLSAPHASTPPAAPAQDHTATDLAIPHASDPGQDATAHPHAPALAPSPRIDSHSTSWGANHAAQGAEPVPSQGAPNIPSQIMPRAPTAFDAPRDPAKLAAASSGLTPSTTLPNLPSSMSRASSLFDSRFGNASSPPRTSSRALPTARSSAPLRHFVHRPTLHLPPQLGVTPDEDASGGLNFSLTLSLPSHVHVSGPKSDVLSFGVQIEVGRTEGWEALKKWGGLRLKDMELVCLQTERHSSMPSRSFCAAFPVPPLPNHVDAADVPVVTYVQKASSTSNDREKQAEAAAEKRLRQSYDRSLILGHITLANQGKAPHPVENNVERIRTTIVGPPPSDLRSQGQESSKEASNAARKGKTTSGGSSVDRRDGLSGSPSRRSPAGSRTNTPDGSSQGAGVGSLRTAFAPAAQLNMGSRTSVMQPLPRASAHSNNSSSSSLRQNLRGMDGSDTMQPLTGTLGIDSSGGVLPTVPIGRSRRPIPPELGAVASSETTSRSLPMHGPSSDTVDFEEALTSQAGATNARGTVRSNLDEHADAHMLESEPPRRVSPDSRAANMGISSVVATGAAPRSSRGPPRRSRFETAMSRLSTFASSMLEQPTEASAGAGSTEARGNPRATSAAGAGSASAAAASLRATYAFSGDDAEGVDLTKGRIRMTINLPLVSSDMDAARKAGSAQLIPDFESPYVRVRHKLKVKLGFGLKSNVASGHEGQDWAQALVMCVPVRFTEAPPKEVQDQFGPVTISTSTLSEATPAEHSSSTGATVPASELATTGGESSAAAPYGPESALPVPFAEPLLPAYAQLFREDGSRLADEGEDLPRYPGRMSVIGEIDEDPASGGGAQSGADDGVVDGLAESHTSAASEQDTEAAAQAMASNREDASRGAATADVDVSRGGTMTLPRTSSLGCLSMPMDRSTSLPGRRMVSRASSSSLFGLPSGLRSVSLQSSVPSTGQSVPSSPFAERTSSMGGGRMRVGSAAFDPLPSRPGMRARSATTTSVMSSSRIMPAEVLDEALVTSVLDDEEDRMEVLQPSRTMDSLQGRDAEALDLIGQDEDVEIDEEDIEMDNVQEAAADLEDQDDAAEDLEGEDSVGPDSEAGHTTTTTMYALSGAHMHRQLSRDGRSNEQGAGDVVDDEVGMAF